MALDMSERGILETLIDKLTTLGTPATQMIRDNKTSFGIKNESDFAVGFVVGLILANFTSLMSGVRSGPLSAEEVRETVSIIARRSKEIHEAIFKAG